MVFVPGQQHLPLTTKSTPLTTNDRMLQKLAEVKSWIANNGREPRKDGDLKEKMMCAAMKALKEKGVEV